MSTTTEIGAKVSFKLGKSWVSARVVDKAPATNHAYERVRLRAAIYNPLTGTWITSDYPKPVQGYRLRARATYIPALDDDNDESTKGA